MTYKISNFTCWDWLKLCSYEYAYIRHTVLIVAQEYTSTFYMNLANKVFISECYLLQGKDILKFMTPLCRGGRHSKANKGLVERKIFYCVQLSRWADGLCIQKWEVFSWEPLSHVGQAIIQDVNWGLLPHYSSSQSKSQVSIPKHPGMVRSLCWQYTMDDLMPILRNPRQEDSTEK